MEALYPWQADLWTKLAREFASLPHAWLFVGSEGVGKRHFARLLAKRLLCRMAQGAALACGTCQSCRWLDAGSHPGYHWLQPDSEETLADEAADGAARSEKARSKQIRIAQVRALQDQLNVGAQGGVLRIACLAPAEAMNRVAQNALLKTLEEPPPGTLFILVSDVPSALLPTVRSRTRAVTFPVPAASASAAWAASQGVSPALLAACGGRPLVAAELAANGHGEWLTAFIADLGGRVASHPVEVAMRWESWLRPRTDAVPPLSVSRLVDWMQKWLADLIALAGAGRARFFPNDPALASLAARTRLEALFACYNALLELRKLADHPLNQRLVAVDMALRYAQAIGQPNPA